MIKINPIWIFSLALLVLSIGFIFLIAKLFTKPIDNERAVFTRVFPFEVINNLDRGYQVYKIIMFVFGFMCFSPLFTLAENTGFYSNLNSLTTIISILFGFGGVIFIFLNLFNPSNVKVHLTLVTIFTVLVFASGVLSTVISVLIYRASDNALMNLILGAITLVLALTELVSVFTFNLRNWAKLESENKVLKRPRFFPLAAFEWLSVLLLTLEEVLYLFIIIKY